MVHIYFIKQVIDCFFISLDSKNCKIFVENLSKLLSWKGFLAELDVDQLSTIILNKEVNLNKEYVTNYS